MATTEHADQLSGLESHRPDATRRVQVPEGQVSPSPKEAEPEPMAPNLHRRPRLKLHKRLENYITAIFKLGRTERMAKQAGRSIQALEARLNDELGHIHARLETLDQRFSKSADKGRQLDEQGAALTGGQAALSRSISDLTARLDRLMLRHSTAEEGGRIASRSSVSPGGEGLEAFKDQFYHRLENRYRGSREEISKRLQTYLPDVRSAVARSGDLPVLDLGCGRGEWLGLLKMEGITARGIDTNSVQIAEARDIGLDASEGDALQALGETADASLSVISAHHLIEHLPFDSVAWIVREAQRVLAPGGLLLMETPNTRNVLVGATTFHTDPTHLKPMPAQVMEVLLETAGFNPVEIRHLNAHERFDEFLGKPDMNDELAFLLFGPQDLAVLGTRPES